MRSCIIGVTILAALFGWRNVHYHYGRSASPHPA